MNDDIRNAIQVFIVVIILLIGILVLGSRVDKLKQQAIQLNYAEYNLTNGHWQWKTNSILTSDKK